MLKRLLNGQQVPEGEFMISIIAEKGTYGPVRISSTAPETPMQLELLILHCPSNRLFVFIHGLLNDFIRVEIQFFQPAKYDCWHWLTIFRVISNKVRNRTAQLLIGFHRAAWLLLRNGLILFRLLLAPPGQPRLINRFRLEIAIVWRFIKLTPGSLHPGSHTFNCRFLCHISYLNIPTIPPCVFTSE